MKWKFQFSLSSLLWLTLCLALLIASLVMYHRMIQAEQQISRAEQLKTEAETQAALMRKAAGYLVVGDRQLVHGIEVKTYEPFTRKWRLYLPEKRSYVLKFASGEIPAHGKPTGQTDDFNIAGEGEGVLCMQIRHREDNQWYMYISYENEILDLKKGAYVASSTRMGTPSQTRIASSAAEHFEPGRLGVFSVFGSSGVETAEPGKPIFLTRERFAKSNAPGSSISSGGPPMPGYMLWLEEQK